MISTAITDKKTFSDLASLKECLQEIADERNDGNAMALWSNGHLLTELVTVVDPATGSEWIELR